MANMYRCRVPGEALQFFPRPLPGAGRLRQPLR